MDGDADYDLEGISVIIITAADRILFKELEEDGAKKAFLWETDSGFVVCAINGAMGDKVNEEAAA